MERTQPGFPVRGGYPLDRGKELMAEVPVLGHVACTVRDCSLPYADS